MCAASTESNTLRVLSYMQCSSNSCHTCLNEHTSKKYEGILKCSQPHQDKRAQLHFWDIAIYNKALHYRPQKLLFVIINIKKGGKHWAVVLLLQDNAPVHTAQVTVAEAAKCRFELLPHVPAWPYLVSICFQN